MDRILDDVVGVHGFLEAAGDALHGSTTTLCIKSLVRIHLVCEGMAQGNGCKEHLHTNDEVLISSSYCAFTHRHVGRVDFGDGTTLFQDGQQHPLPEGEEDDRLHHEELEDWAVGAEQLSCGEVEKEEGIECQADGDVVDDGHVEVAAGYIKVTILVFVKGLKDDCADRHEGLHHTELQGSLFAESQESNRICLSPQAASPIYTAGLDWFSSDLRHDGALPSQVLIAEAEKVVYYKGCEDINHSKMTTNIKTGARTKRAGNRPNSSRDCLCSIFPFKALQFVFTVFNSLPQHLQDCLNWSLAKVPGQIYSSCQKGHRTI